VQLETHLETQKDNLKGQILSKITDFTNKAGGLWRTSTRPTLNVLLLLHYLHLLLLHPSSSSFSSSSYTCSSVCMSIHPKGKPCSDLGRVLILNDPPARRRRSATGGWSSSPGGCRRATRRSSSTSWRTTSAR